MSKDKIEKECWYDRFESPEQYVKVKIHMLKHDMYIKPTEEEVEHLYSLRNQTAIDNAVHSIMDRHWKDKWEKN